MGADSPSDNPPDFASSVSTDESVERGCGLFKILASRRGAWAGVQRLMSGRHSLLL